MNKVSTLRKGVNVVLTETENRVQGVLEAAERAVSIFVFTIFSAATAAVNQVVDIAFDLAKVVVEEAFNVAESVVTATLGEVSFDEEMNSVGTDKKSFSPVLDITGDVSLEELSETEIIGDEFLPDYGDSVQVEIDNDTPSVIKGTD
ncbi:hypothetical protein LCGC14_1445310 [marine sediment metagenome]|uniref:Uncharacterized protein n=1 Tax=marine sediment metagenome TaxID=412755 RepID=A0A0F9K5P5_9ZZZZ